MKNSNISNRDQSQRSSHIIINRKKDGTQSIEPQNKLSELQSALEAEKNISKSFKEKVERLSLKNQFLYNKLIAVGNIEGIPETISSEIVSIDTKIKSLEELLFFQRKNQNEKLKKKVLAFLIELNFEVGEVDINKLEDEFEIIMFLLEIFSERYRQIMKERSDIDEIINRIEKDNFQDKNQELKFQNLKLNSKVLELQKLLIESSKKQSLKVQPMKDQFAQKSIAPLKNSINVENQITIEQLQSKIKELEITILENNNKMILVDKQLTRYKRQQLRLKERYKAMESQKNQRIRLLESSRIKKHQ